MQHKAQGNLLCGGAKTGDHTGTLRNKLGIHRESSQTTRFSRSAYKIELNDEQEARRVQVGKFQAIVHKIQLNEETELRRVQVGTLQTIARKIELDVETEARREQPGTLQAITHKIELNEETEARRTSRHASGGVGTGPN